MTISGMGCIFRMRQARNITAYPFLNGQKGLLITRAAQCRDVRLGETLVLALQGLGEIDVCNLTLFLQAFQVRGCFAGHLPKTVDYRRRHVIKGLRPAGADVEDSAFLRTIQEKQVHRRHVLHRDEIASLFAVTVSVATFEQLYLAGLAVLVEMMKCHRGHATLVLLAVAIDIEITDPDDLHKGRMASVA